MQTAVLLVRMREIRMVEKTVVLMVASRAVQMARQTVDLRAAWWGALLAAR